MAQAIGKLPKIEIEEQKLAKTETGDTPEDFRAIHHRNSDKINQDLVKSSKSNTDEREGESAVKPLL